MDNTTLQQFQMADRPTQERLTKAHCFRVSKSLLQAATAMAAKAINGAEEDGSTIHLPSSARLPGNSIAISCEGDTAGVTLLEVSADVSKGINVSVVTEGVVLPCATFTPGSNSIFLHMGRHGNYIRENLSDNEIETLKVMLLRYAMVVSLINEPRRVVVSTASGIDWTRQHRRRVERITGKAAMAYSVVSWQVGAGVKAKGNPGGDSDLKVALHWCRGHWRKADPEWENAEWVAPTQGAPCGWYIWVKDCWKGHPDHGIKLQDHKPRMKGEKVRRGSHAPSSVPNATRLAAMSAQQRAMLVQAGHAPSGALH